LQIDRLFEELGIKYFSYLQKKVKDKNYQHIEGIPSDRVLKVIAQNTTVNSVIIAFLIGALTTVPAVFFEMSYKENMPTKEFYIYLSLITIFMLVIELGVLYWLSLKAVYTLANILGYEKIDFDPGVPTEYQVEKLLVRTALEIPDPNIKYLGIDLQKNISQKKILLFSLLYKAKVILSSVLLKLLFRRIFARFGVRVGFEWVSIPVTAFWDAFVMAKVIKDAKLRLFGYQLSQFIIHQIFTKEFLSTMSYELRLVSIRAVASVVVLSKHYHPNNLLILVKLGENLKVDEEDDYDNREIFFKEYEKLNGEEKEFIKALIAIVAAFDGKLSKEEKEFLPTIFKNETDAYFKHIENIIDLLEDGALHKVASIVEELLKSHLAGI